MFIKEAVVSASRKLLPHKELQRWEQNLVQFLFLTAIKNYFYSWISQDTPFNIPQHVIQKAQKHKITLVLDMDQTLVYTRRATRPPHSQYTPTPFKGQTMYVEHRPLARQFLQAASQIFNIYVYTAGQKKYADAVLNVMDQDNLIERRFYRDSCKKENGIIVKDLKHLKRVAKNKQEMILVDDNHLSIEKNYPFAIQVQAFEGEQQDRALLVVFEKVLKFYI